MIVRQFLQWVRAARPGERAEATSALARAYLHSDLSPDDLAAAEGAMIMLLDDPSPLVRQAMSEVFASSQKAPPVVVHALAADQPEVALPLIERSPLSGGSRILSIWSPPASRRCRSQLRAAAVITIAVAAEIAEIGYSDACLALLENSDADITLARSSASSIASGISPRFANLLARETCRCRCGSRCYRNSRRRSPALSPSGMARTGHAEYARARGV